MNKQKRKSGINTGKLTGPRFAHQSAPRTILKQGTEQKANCHKHLVTNTNTHFENFSQPCQRKINYRETIKSFQISEQVEELLDSNTNTKKTMWRSRYIFSNHINYFMNINSLFKQTWKYLISILNKFVRN